MCHLASAGKGTRWSVVEYEVGWAGEKTVRLCRCVRFGSGDVGVSALAGAECQTGSVLLEEEQNNDCHHHHELSFSMTAVISVQFDNSIKGPTLEQLRRTPSPPSSDLADSRA